MLKPTGSLYLHCDPTASHYLKLLLDSVFGPAAYRTEISWKRSSAHSDAKQGRKQYGNIRDVIFFYTKSNDWTWNWLFTEYPSDYADSAYRLTDADGRRYRRDNLTAAKPGGDVSYLWPVRRPLGGHWEADLENEYECPKEGWEYKQVPPYNRRYWAYSKENMRRFAIEGRLAYASSGMPEYKRYLDEMPGVPLQNDWDDIPPAVGSENLGYPTQKPLALLERIIAASSNADQVVLDPFCGCGTAVHAAQKLGRQWIGIDITHLAIHLIEKRLHDAFDKPGESYVVPFEVHGTPRDLASAQDLAKRDKHQFELWALAQVDAVPWKGGRKGPDGGIDGIIYFKPDGKRTEKAIVEVKGGGTGVKDIGRLAQVMEREKAPLGVFVTAEMPTSAMIKDAAAVGRFEDEWERTYPRLQIITLAELFQGKKPDIPFIDPSSIKRAKREDTSQQGQLI